MQTIVVGLQNGQLFFDGLVRRVVFVNAIFQFADFSGHAFGIEIGVGPALATDGSDTGAANYPTNHK